MKSEDKRPQAGKGLGGAQVTGGKHDQRESARIQGGVQESAAPPITMQPTATLLPDHVAFQGVTATWKVDRAKYAIRTRDSLDTRPPLGQRIRSNRRRYIRRGREYTIFTDTCLLFGRHVYVSWRDSNPFWSTLAVDDPTEEYENRIWKALDHFPKVDAKLSEVEIALDLHPAQPGDEMRLKRCVLQHLLLPHAHAPARPYPATGYGLDATWYYGSQRGGPRSVKVYDKTLDGKNPIDVVRIEWTIHGRFGKYGIDPRQVTNLAGLRVEKLLRWGWFDWERAAELEYLRDHGHRLHPRDPWRGVVLAHYQSTLDIELAGGWGNGHIMVLGQMKQRYKELDWTRPHDIPKVFPPLP